MQTVKENAEFANSSNDALLKICDRQIKALEEICRIPAWNIFKARRIAQAALDDRAIQLNPLI